MDKIIKKFETASQILKELENTKGNLVNEEAERVSKLANSTNPPTELEVESFRLNLRSTFLGIILSELEANG